MSLLKFMDRKFSQHLNLDRYYITGAPQCVYPDASLGGVLNTASFDAIYVQFCTSRNFPPHQGLTDLRVIIR